MSVGPSFGDPPSRDGLPPLLGGKYTPIRVVATGGMGTVYEVEHEHTGERLALKVLKGGVAELDPTALERFRLEARVAARVKSEHIVRVVDADVAPELGGVPFLVMDLLEGANLSDAAGEEPQPPERIVDWLSQVARALDKAHAIGIIHRDLKPENLFLAKRPDGTPIVKILDFGVAKIRTDGDGNRTASGALLGTPLYMAPEQVEAASDRIGPGTDMWSLALIAHRLLTGRHYWAANSVSLLLVDILKGELKPPSSRGARVGPKFDAWFLRSCDRDPTRRWNSVGEQMDALADSFGVAPLPPRASERDPSLADTFAHPSTPHISAASAVVQSMSGSVASARPATTRRPVPVVAGVIGVLIIGTLIAGLLHTGRVHSSEGSEAVVAAPASRSVVAPAAGIPSGIVPSPTTPDSPIASALPAETAGTIPASSSTPPPRPGLHSTAVGAHQRALATVPTAIAAGAADVRVRARERDPLADPK